MKKYQKSFGGFIFVSRVLVTITVSLLCGLLLVASAQAEDLGGIRGVATDKDFEVPLAGVNVSVAETGAAVEADDTGHFMIQGVAPGSYTLVFRKDGYERVVKRDVVVGAGQMGEVEVALPGSYADMDEFVVRDIELGGSSELGLLNLRMDNAAMMDSIGVDQMSKAGVSDAAGALKLVSGATVQDGKYAVVRGLPDRYVSTQMNGVRLPSADPDVRAVQLDQFPSAMIESIQVTKTFTPDQQGDASGGAVNVILKGIPEEDILSVKVGSSYNSNTTGSDDFLTYDGGGVGTWGTKSDSIFAQAAGTDWSGAVGTTTDDAPYAYDWSITSGGKREMANGLRVGAIGNLYYKTDSSSYDDGVNDEWWIEDGDMVPSWTGESNDLGDQFKTSLFDVEQSTEEVEWGGMGAVGVESDKHSIMLLYSRTHVAEETATLAEDTRGKDWYVTSQVDGYDPTGAQEGNRTDGFTSYADSAPYRRQQTLEYTERDTDTLQLIGKHVVPLPELGKEGVFRLLQPEVDWTLAHSVSEVYTYKVMFGSIWQHEATEYYTYRGSTITNTASSAGYYQDKPDVDYLGNLQYVWEKTIEESDQYFVNAKWPFENWSGEEGYVKLGIFDDQVDRAYDKDSYSNFDDDYTGASLDWDEFWSDYWEDEDHIIYEAEVDADYDGTQDITAWYYMADLPLTSFFKVVGGARYERTELTTKIYPEDEVYWVVEDDSGSSTLTELNEGDADIEYAQNDLLPSIGCELRPIESVALRASYSQTVARQTFKELIPIQQQEYLGGDIFIGNNELTMSALDNYDLRMDYSPYVGGLVSLSWFAKDIDDPIEYVQAYVDNVGVYTTPVNYPEGEIDGWEVEFRHDLGHFWESCEGVSLTANATFIDSEVTIPDDEQEELEAVGFGAETRDMMNCPEYLYNLGITYELRDRGTQVSLFYSYQGDSLSEGAYADGEYIPSVYALGYGTLNATFSQQFGENWKFGLKAKNLTNPKIQEVYREDGYEDTVKTSYTKGISLSMSLTRSW